MFITVCNTTAIAHVNSVSAATQSITTFDLLMQKDKELLNKERTGNKFVNWRRILIRIQGV